MASGSDPSVHVVVVHHRGRELLERCLATLRVSRNVDLRVILVLNGCREGLPPAALSPEVQRVESEKALGFSAANNLGVAWGRERLGLPELYLFLNNDAEVEPDAVALLAAALEGHPEAAVAGPRLMIHGAPEHLNSLGLNLTRTGLAWDEGIGRRLEEYGPLPGLRPVLAVTGSALLIRAAALERVGGWEELYGFYFEDIDLCLRCRTWGWEVIHVPEAVVYHAISKTAIRGSKLKTVLSWRNSFVLMAIHWPCVHLLEAVGRRAPEELFMFLRRLWYGEREWARWQLRSWLEALVLLPRALARRRGRGPSRSWWSLLEPTGVVPVIELPEPGSKPPQPGEPAAKAPGPEWWG